MEDGHAILPKTLLLAVCARDVRSCFFQDRMSEEALRQRADAGSVNEVSPARHHPAGDVHGIERAGNITRCANKYRFGKLVWMQRSLPVRSGVTGKDRWECRMVIVKLGPKVAEIGHFWWHVRMVRSICDMLAHSPANAFWTPRVSSDDSLDGQRSHRRHLSIIIGSIAGRGQYIVVAIISARTERDHSCVE